MPRCPPGPHSHPSYQLSNIQVLFQGMQATLLFFHSTAMANPRSNPREANDQKFQLSFKTKEEEDSNWNHEGVISCVLLRLIFLEVE